MRIVYALLSVMLVSLACASGVQAQVAASIDPLQEYFGDEPYCTINLDLKECVAPIVTGQIPGDPTEPAVPAAPYVPHPPLPEEISPNADVTTGTTVGLAIDEDLMARVDAGEMTMAQALAAKPPITCKATASGRSTLQMDNVGWEVYYASKAECTEPASIGGQAYLTTPRGTVEVSGNQVDKVGVRGISDGFYKERRRDSHISLGVWRFTIRKPWAAWSPTCRRVPGQLNTLTCTASSGVFR